MYSRVSPPRKARGALCCGSRRSPWLVAPARLPTCQDPTRRRPAVNIEVHHQSANLPGSVTLQEPREVRLSSEQAPGTHCQNPGNPRRWPRSVHHHIRSDLPRSHHSLPRGLAIANVPAWPAKRRVLHRASKASTSHAGQTAGLSGVHTEHQATATAAATATTTHLLRGSMLSACWYVASAM